MAATGGTIPEHDDPAHSAHYEAEEHDRVLMNHMAEPFVRWANWAAHEAIARHIEDETHRAICGKRAIRVWQRATRHEYLRRATKADLQQQLRARTHAGRVGHC